MDTYSIAGVTNGRMIIKLGESDHLRFGAVISQERTGQLNAECKTTMAG
jgi:hypothetical protein